MLKYDTDQRGYVIGLTKEQQRASQMLRPIDTRGELVMSLSEALSGTREATTGSAGMLSFYRRGNGRPLLLLHSINAAASAYEMRGIYERTPNHVFAPDLPGFGFSERSNRDYSPGLYVQAIGDMLEIIRRFHSDPVDAIALSLSCEFLARAALKWPDRFRRLVFITPTGFQRGADRLRESEGATRQVPGIYPVVSTPLLSDALFSLLTTRASIRYFLRKTWGSDVIDEGLLRYAYETSHQAGAKHAPLAFLSGKLFAADIRDRYEGLTHPIWMPHATRGDFADFSEAGWIADRTNWHAEPFPTGALVHFEKPDAFMSKLNDFLADGAFPRRAFG